MLGVWGLNIVSNFRSVLAKAIGLEPTGRSRSDVLRHRPSPTLILTCTVGDRPAPTWPRDCRHRKGGSRRLGLDVSAFGAHSLRSGLVTSALNRGVSLLKICDQTRHKSIEMLRIYCRDAELFVGNAAAGLL
jgi:hypothetical protein